MPPLVEPTPPPENEEVPVERAALRDQLDRVQEEKRRALADPGPSWREWWFYSASKWYVGLGLLIVDVWVGGIWLEAGLWVAALLSVVGVLYLEFLLYQYLYYRPGPDDEPGPGAERNVWLHPVDYGRWTPEGHTLRTGGTVPRGPQGPTPEEFL